MAALIPILWGLTILLSIPALVCFVLVLIKMFKNDQTVLAVVCIVLIFCGGPLIAFVYGWIKSKEWDLKKVMLGWTAVIVAQLVLGIALGGVLAAVGASAARDFQDQLNNEFNIEDGLDIDMGSTDDFDLGGEGGEITLPDQPDISIDPGNDTPALPDINLQPATQDE